MLLVRVPLMLQHVHQRLFGIPTDELRFQYDDGGSNSRGQQRRRTKTPTQTPKTKVTTLLTSKTDRTSTENHSRWIHFEWRKLNGEWISESNWIGLFGGVVKLRLPGWRKRNSLGGCASGLLLQSQIQSVFRPGGKISRASLYLTASNVVSNSTFGLCKLFGLCLLATTLLCASIKRPGSVYIVTLLVLPRLGGSARSTQLSCSEESSSCILASIFANNVPFPLLWRLAIAIEIELTLSRRIIRITQFHEDRLVGRFRSSRKFLSDC